MAKPLSDAIRKNLPHNAVIFALASWARFLHGIDERGASIPLEDANAEVISAAANNSRSDPKAFLITAGVQGLSKSQLDATAEEFKTQLDKINRKGTENALEEVIRSK
jgi:mannitol 2-dehydrogenase